MDIKIIRFEFDPASALTNCIDALKIVFDFLQEPTTKIFNRYYRNHLEKSTVSSHTTKLKSRLYHERGRHLLEEVQADAVSMSKQ